MSRPEKQSYVFKDDLNAGSEVDESPLNFKQDNRMVNNLSEEEDLSDLWGE